MGRVGKLAVVGLIVVFGCVPVAFAQKQGSVSRAPSSGTSSHNRGPRCAPGGWGAVSSGWWYGPGGFWGYPIVAPPIYMGPTIIVTPNGVFSQTPITLGGAFVPQPMGFGGGFGGGGIPGANPVADAWIPPAEPPRPNARAVRRAAERLEELVKVGDRLFRAGEFKRALDRYEDAARVDPNSALPHMRRAQVAIKKADYVQAVACLRDAQIADADWVDHLPARDVQNLFGEPADFAAELAALETHLQANPEDRDAWLVLGTELFLTGRTERAADIFVRLTDRKPDALLARFLEAVNQP